MKDWDEATQTATPLIWARGEEKTSERCPYLVSIAGNNTGEMYQLHASQVIGRADGCNIRIQDEGVSRFHARVEIEEDGSALLTDLGSRNGTFINGQPIQQRAALADGDKIQLGKITILKFSYHDRYDEAFQRGMLNRAVQDNLTGCFNKAFFLERLKGEFAYAARHGTALGVLIFDIDFFKAVNDTYGHLAGDHVLSAIGKLLRSQIRAEDVIARYGGEEFTLLTRGITARDAAAVGDRIRAAVQNAAISFEGQLLNITVSVGAAVFPNPRIENAIALLGAADTALYEAKRGGRNRVVVA